METIFCYKAGKCCAWFKSYYVVWKQLAVNRVLRVDIMFKSYYVVWKLAKNPKIIGSTICLNRTM